MATIEYNDELHQYTLNGEVVPSVTQIAKEFSNMKTEWLEAHPEYAVRGTLIHNELASYYRGDLMEEDLSEAARVLQAKVGKRSDSVQAEVLVYNEEKKYAGTIDIVKVEGKDVFYILDFKTGDHPNKKYCYCQLNLYRMALKSMGMNTENAVMAVVTPSDLIMVPVMSFEDLQAMRVCDYEPEGEVAKRIEELLADIKALEPQVEAYEERKAELKELLVAKFEESKTNSYFGDGYTISYAPASTRKTLDTKMVREALGARTEEFMKDSTVSATIRIKKQ